VTKQVSSGLAKLCFLESSFSSRTRTLVGKVVELAIVMPLRPSGSLLPDFFLQKAPKLSRIALDSDTLAISTS
jgi:hypothetical protein